MSIVLLLTLACSASPVGEPTAEPAAGVAPVQAVELDIAGLRARVDAGDIVVVDVRTAEEHAGGHVPGAILLPLQELEDRVAELEVHRGQELAIICASGGRSARATELLRARGFAARNVAGGTRAWIAAGHPTE